MEEHMQLYICPTCNSIKTIFGEAATIEEFKQNIPEHLPCGIDGCEDFALKVDKICLGKGHVHGYLYYREATTGLIFCSMHKEEFKWIPLRNDNVLDYTPDKEDPLRRENW